MASHKNSNAQTATPDTVFLWELAAGEAYIDATDDLFLPADIQAFFDALLRELKIRYKIELLRKAGLAGTKNEPYQYGYEVLRGESQASRIYYIKIALGVGLDLRTTQRMLAITGVGCLHPRNEQDAAILYAIINKLTYEQYEKLDLKTMLQDSVEAEENGKPLESYTTGAWDMLERGKFPGRNLFLPDDIARYFDSLLEQFGISEKSELLKRANFGNYGYEILSGETLAHRDYYIRIALALGLNIRDTQRLLALTGRGCLHPRIKRDFFIISAINHRFDSDRTYDYLISQNLKPLEKDE